MPTRGVERIGSAPLEMPRDHLRIVRVTRHNKMCVIRQDGAGIHRVLRFPGSIRETSRDLKRLPPVEPHRRIPQRALRILPALSVMGA